MKKFIITVLIILTITSHVSAEYYPMTTIVNKIDYIEDTVTCIDFNGNEWVFKEIEDWEINDIASMIMDDMGTELIYDDTIIMVQYGGYIEGFLSLIFIGCNTSNYMY